MIAAWATQMPLSIKTLTELIKATGGGQCALAASAVPAGLLVAEGACACAAADAADTCAAVAVGGSGAGRAGGAEVCLWRENSIADVWGTSVFP